MSNELAKLDVPVKLLIDSAVAYTMDEVDMVFVGADGVVESGGIINMMGTYQIALVAHGMNKPVYVAAESYKVYLQFAKLDFMLACTHLFRKVALNLCVVNVLFVMVFCSLLVSTLLTKRI